MKFKRLKKAGLMDAVEIHFVETSQGEDHPDPFTMIATGSGIRMQGRSRVIYTMEDLQSWAKAVDDVYREHQTLKPKLSATLSGH